MNKLDCDTQYEWYLHMTNTTSFYLLQICKRSLTQHTFLNIGIISQIQPAKENIQYFLIKPLIWYFELIIWCVINNLIIVMNSEAKKKNVA
jgi:hypothetical protein